MREPLPVLLAGGLQPSNHQTARPAGTAIRRARPGGDQHGRTAMVQRHQRRNSTGPPPRNVRARPHTAHRTPPARRPRPGGWYRTTTTPGRRHHPAKSASPTGHPHRRGATARGRWRGGRRLAATARIAINGAATPRPPAKIPRKGRASPAHGPAPTERPPRAGGPGVDRVAGGRRDGSEDSRVTTRRTAARES